MKILLLAAFLKAAMGFCQDPGKEPELAEISQDIKEPELMVPEFKSSSSSCLDMDSRYQTREQWQDSGTSQTVLLCPELLKLERHVQALLSDPDFPILFSPLDLIDKALDAFTKGQQTPEDKLNTFNKIINLIKNNKETIKKEKCCKKHATTQKIIKSNLSWNHKQSLICEIENTKKQPKKHKKATKKPKKISITNQQ